MAQYPPVIGVVAKYYGSANLGTTNYYYWVQAVYDGGAASLSAPASTGAKLPAGLSTNNRVQLTWNAMPGAIGYYVFSNTTGTQPTTGALRFVADAQTGFNDVGQPPLSATSPVKVDGLNVARCYYNFAADGGANGAIVPSVSDTIPATAILVGATVNSSVAVLPTSATISIGTTAGSTATSILAATAGTTLTIDALVNGVPTFAAPRKMTAAGQINVTIASGPVTAGVVEIFVYYVTATNP